MAPAFCNAEVTQACHAPADTHIACMEPSMKTTKPTPPAPAMASPDTSIATPLRVPPPWLIPAFGALLMLVTGLVWAVVL
jgi:hypothetical protein